MGDVRPPGMPTYGWTEGGKIIKLSGKIVPGFDPIVKVTREGWDAWYPVTKGEYIVREKKPPKGKFKPKLLELWEGVHDEEESTEGRGAYWRFRS